MLGHQGIKESKMTRLVMKFGGTSVADIEHIRKAAQHVAREAKAGRQPVVVVSAMAGVTNELAGFVQNAAPQYNAREYDAVVSSGEQVTAGLMALDLARHGPEGARLAGLAGAAPDRRYARQCRE